MNASKIPARQDFLKVAAVISAFIDHPPCADAEYSEKPRRHFTLQEIGKFTNLNYVYPNAIKSKISDTEIAEIINTLRYCGLLTTIENVISQGVISWQFRLR